MIDLRLRGLKERPECYHLSHQVMGSHVPLDNIRLELTPTRFYLLPYHHLELAEFVSAHDRDTIALSFVNHKVRIAGRNLRYLAVALQERAVEWVMPVPEKYAEAWEGAQGLIQSIEFE